MTGGTLWCYFIFEVKIIQKKIKNITAKKSTTTSMSSIVKLFVICYIFGTVYLYSPSRLLSSSSSVSNAICIVRVAPAQKPKIIFDSTAKICACGHWWRHRRRPPNDASSTSRNLKISHTHTYRQTERNRNRDSTQTVS